MISPEKYIQLGQEDEGRTKIVVVDKGIKIGLKTEWDIKLQR